MPLDGHSYLISQGWSGLGTGLRQDALIRPLAIPPKRTLSGLGKDRDEAFPFWDQFRFLFPSLLNFWYSFITVCFLSRRKRSRSRCTKMTTMTMTIHLLYVLFVVFYYFKHEIPHRADLIPFLLQTPNS